MSLTSAVWRRPQPAAAAAATATTAIHVFQERPSFISSLLPASFGDARRARRFWPSARPLGYAGPGQTRERYRARARVSNAFRYARADARDAKRPRRAPRREARSRPRRARDRRAPLALVDSVLPRRAHVRRRRLARAFRRPPSVAQRSPSRAPSRSLAAWPLSRVSRDRAPAVSRWLLLSLLPFVPVLTGRAPPPPRRCRAACCGSWSGPCSPWGSSAWLAARGVRPGAAPAGALFAAAFLFYARGASASPARGPAGRRAPLPRHGAEPAQRRRPRPRRTSSPGANTRPSTGATSRRTRRRTRRRAACTRCTRPGLPALLLPAYAAGGYRGARALPVRARRARRASLLYRLVRDVDRRRAVAAAALGPRRLRSAARRSSRSPCTRRPSPRSPIVAFLLAARATPRPGSARRRDRSSPSSCPGSTRSTSRSPPPGLVFTLLRPVSLAGARAARPRSSPFRWRCLACVLPRRITAARRSPPRSARPT